MCSPRSAKRSRRRDGVASAKLTSMVAQRSLPLEEDSDQRVLMAGTWKDYETLLAMRGDRAGVRLYYLDGSIEIMSPGSDHASNKKKLARLLEHWAIETGVEIEGFGSWTLKRRQQKAGAEPDECYTLGDRGQKKVPDLALDVEWSRVLGLDKEEIYKRLGVRELWTLKSDGALVVRVLVDGEWVPSKKSKLLPMLDLAWLASFLEIPTQTKAVLALREALRTKKRSRK